MNHKIFIILFSLICILISCKTKTQFYDINGPVLNFFYYKNDYILFQFNEPVTELELFLKKNDKNKVINIKNEFPIANIIVPDTFFSFKGKLSIKAFDSYKNISYSFIDSPVINNDPAELAIYEIRIRYSKKRKQKISLISKNKGDTTGYHLVIYIHGKKNKIPFETININENNKIDLYINSSGEIMNNDYTIDFNKHKQEFIFKYRLSQTCSCFYIENNKNEILDYFLYYDSRKHDIDYYRNNKNYKKYVNDLKNHNINPESFDINGTTTIKTIVKNKFKFVIKNN